MSGNGRETCQPSGLEAAENIDISNDNLDCVIINAAEKRSGNITKKSILDCIYENRSCQ